MEPEKKRVVTLRFTEWDLSRLKQGALQERRSVAGQVEYITLMWLDGAVPVMQDPDRAPAPSVPPPDSSPAPRWDVAKHGSRGPFWKLPGETQAQMAQRLRPPEPRDGDLRPPRDDDDGPAFP